MNVITFENDNVDRSSREDFSLYKFYFRMLQAIISLYAGCIFRLYKLFSYDAFYILCFIIILYYIHFSGFPGYNFFLYFSSGYVFCSLTGYIRLRSCCGVVDEDVELLLPWRRLSSDSDLTSIVVSEINSEGVLVCDAFWEFDVCWSVDVAGKLPVEIVGCPDVTAVVE